jgi:hypothetical protein
MREKGSRTAFDDFLSFMRRFDNLSAYNAMLVKIQRPGAVAAATRSQWISIGRSVVADAVPIVVLQPFGPVGFVYEYGDTIGREVIGERLSSLFAVGQVSELQFERTKSAAWKHGVHVVETRQYGNLLAGTRIQLVAISDFIRVIVLRLRHSSNIRLGRN